MLLAENFWITIYKMPKSKIVAYYSEACFYVCSNCGLSKQFNNNAKREYYLTDVFGLARQQNIIINLLKVPFCPTLLGVNDKKELGDLERFYQKQQAYWLQKQGVSILDSSRFSSWIRGTRRL